MRILFDQGTPVPLRTFLNQHRIETAFERGWSELKNGDLLDRAEADGFDILITTDQNLRYQQHLPIRKIALIVLKTTSWPLIKAKADLVEDAVTAASEVLYQEIDF
ncbi:MAG: hypothetical protein ACJ73D_03050 [Pyrinomonadaceae bacterium]